MDVADSEEGGDVGFVGLGGEGIPEEDDRLDGTLDDSGADLKVPSVRTGGEALDVEPGLLIEDGAGGPGGEEREAGEQGLVIFGEGRQIEFPLVVGDQGDGFAFHDEEGPGLSNGRTHATGPSSPCRIPFLTLTTP